MIIKLKDPSISKFKDIKRGTVFRLNDRTYMKIRSVYQDLDPMNSVDLLNGSLYNVGDDTFIAPVTRCVLSNGD